MNLLQRQIQSVNGWVKCSLMKDIKYSRGTLLISKKNKYILILSSVLINEPKSWIPISGPSYIVKVSDVMAPRLTSSHIISIIQPAYLKDYKVSLKATLKYL